MAKRKTLPLESQPEVTYPAMSPEARENQLTPLAMDRLEHRLRDGTATSQEVLYCAKLGSVQQKLEIEKLKLETELVKAKTEAIKAQQHADEAYQQAIEAFRSYSGNGDE